MGTTREQRERAAYIALSEEAEMTPFASGMLCEECGTVWFTDETDHCWSERIHGHDPEAVQEHDLGGDDIELAYFEHVDPRLDGTGTMDLAGFRRAVEWLQMNGGYRLEETVEEEADRETDERVRRAQPSDEEIEAL